jgi:spore germination protein
MQIHVVQPGQTLYGLSQAYSVPVDTIAAANELAVQNSLVVGQAIVIPITGSYYWLQAGESLYTVSQRFDVPVATLAAINRLQVNQTLPVGLRLYLPPRPQRNIESNAYVEPRGETVAPTLIESVQETVELLTYLAPFSFRIQRDGTLAAPPLDNLGAIAAAQGVTLMMVVTNLEKDQFSAELGRIILNDETVQTALLNNIVRTARASGFRDIHFDLEFLRPEDREAYNQFLQRASVRLHNEGFLLSTALAPKTSATQQGAWYEAHDYEAHGRYADFSVIMTYEWGYSGGPAMAVSPIGPVRRVLEYALTEMPASKIMMGQNLYGYDWTLPYVAGGQYARALSPQAAIGLARRTNSRIEYDYTAQAPTFNYVDDQGRTHEVWFEDARSIQAKFNLIKELGLRGISYWKLGLSFPQNWLLLEDNFNVVKR